MRRLTGSGIFRRSQRRVSSCAGEAGIYSEERGGRVRERICSFMKDCVPSMPYITHVSFIMN